MTQTRIERRLQYLTAYAVGSTCLLLILLLGAFSYVQHDRFEEIDVERINVIEPDGQHAMVIANSQRLPGPIIDGKDIAPDQRDGISGIIFYNSEGDENGGLIFHSEKTDSTLSAFEHLSFDRYQQDQTIVLSYSEQDSGWQSGLRIMDRPAHSLLEDIALMEAAQGGDEEAQGRIEELEQSGDYHARRLFVGTEADRSALVQLHDRSGNERIRMSVDVSGTPRLEFFDQNGEVIYSLPEAQ